MLRTAISLILLSSFAVGAAAQNNRRDQRTPPPPQRTYSTVQFLNARIPEVSFTETPFEQVIAWMQELTGANIIVRWQTLEDNGMKRDDPVTLHLKNLSFGQVLSIVMMEAAPSDLRLAYVARGNLITLSTNEELSKEMVVKVYDITDLLLKIPRFSAQSGLDATQAAQGGQGGGTNIFTGGNDDDDELDDDRGGGDAGAETTQLVTLIRDTIEPDSWRENGGEGTIQVFRGQLVIRNTILVHQRLGGYIVESELP